MSSGQASQTSNELVVDEFLRTPYWDSSEAEARLLSADCTLEFPYAPPGMPKEFPPVKRRVLFDWLRRTVKNWTLVEVEKFLTKDTSRFWVESRTTADVTWGGPFSRKFDCTHIQLIVVENGKVSVARTWSDPLAYYLGAGMNLAVFNYSGKFDKVPAPRPEGIEPPKPADEKEAAALRQKLFSNFNWPEDDGTEQQHGTSDPQIFTPDFRVNMPFIPVGMQRMFDAGFAESVNEWMERTVVEWHEARASHVDEFLDPDVRIVETYGSIGKMQWDPNGAVSGYTQDYVIKIKLQNFQIAEFKEYLDPINKLITAGAPIQCFPFFY
ncbi:hypothetical protein SCUCBS95973_001582 [Sporothrix curviconia]|uniref:SnoaL-like domain-containing protein n=1 Tax=Sporothrix curviconia TaxID=1260050 RepID=A0ABP0B026_9PEZI